MRLLSQRARRSSILSLCSKPPQILFPLNFNMLLLQRARRAWTARARHYGSLPRDYLPSGLIAATKYLDLFPRPGGLDGGSNSTAGTEDTAYRGRLRLGGAHYIFQHLIDDVFLKNAEVAIFSQVFLQ
jgi:hypothetical protein